ADRAWYACSPASELSGINGLGNGHPATDLINNAPLIGAFLFLSSTKYKENKSTKRKNKHGIINC
ncbi:hypothetical protein, partial [Aeromonas caviae]|uniref:hypothetical protein n=1 Tax=Aeromonas caviae TaxID=648 RepID=UPI003EC74DF2